MSKFLAAMISSAMVLAIGGAQAQVAQPATPDAGHQRTTTVDDGLSPARKPSGKVGLVRGVLKRIDPIHDELLIHAFGGGDVRIAFDPRTQLLSENTPQHFTSIPAGSVVSVDTAIDHGKLFALSVRTGSYNASELNGQVVRYDAVKSKLTLREPISPDESVSVQITPSTTVLHQGQPASPQALSPGMLVQVWYSPAQLVANRVEILAAPGTSFSFSGRIVSVDLRSRALALSNDSDQSVRELAIASLDSGSLGSLREGVNVSIQAEFDGRCYNARSVTLLSPNPTPVSPNP